MLDNIIRRNTDLIIRMAKNRHVVANHSAHHNGSIILLHDFVKPPSPTPKSLGIIIPYLRENGYEFVTVSELLEDVAESGVRPSFFIG